MFRVFRASGVQGLGFRIVERFQSFRVLGIFCGGFRVEAGLGFRI